MPTTTLAVARQKISEEIGDWRQETTTSAGNSGGTTVVSTALSDKGDDYFNDGNYWIIVTSGTYAGEARRISDFVGSTGTVTVSVAFTGQIANSVTFEVHKFRPVDITRALNAAAQEAYPWVSRRIIDENLITGNWLNDGGFEDWSSATALNQWEAEGSGTFSKQTATYSGKLYGTLGAIVAPGGANGGIRQYTGGNDRLQDLRGETVKFRAMVAAATADHVVRITDTDGSTTSTAHDTVTLWKLLSAERAIGVTGNKSISFMIISPGNYTFYVDNARVVGPPVYDYKLHPDIRHVLRVYMQSTSFDSLYPCDDSSGNFIWTPLFGCNVRDDGTDRWLHTDYSLPVEYKLRLVANGTLSVLSADTDTWEIGNNEPPLRALIALAAHKLYSQYSSVINSQDRSEYKEMAERYWAKWMLLRNQHCFPEPVQIPIYTGKS